MADPRETEPQNRLLNVVHVVVIHSLFFSGLVMMLRLLDTSWPLSIGIAGLAAPFLTVPTVALLCVLVARREAVPEAFGQSNDMGPELVSQAFIDPFDLWDSDRDVEIDHAVRHLSDEAPRSPLIATVRRWDEDAAADTVPDETQVAFEATVDAKKQKVSGGGAV